MAITTNGGSGISADGVATLTNKTLTSPVISNATFQGQQSGLQVAFNDSIVFEGTTADAYETTLSAGEPTADRTVTLPDATTTLVGTDASQTLTNKTLTSPVVSGLYLSDATVVFEGATENSYETTLTVTDPTADRTITFKDASGTVAFTSDITITSSSKLDAFAATSSSELAGVISDETGSGSLVFGTSPVLTTPVIKSPEERLTVSATAAASTVNFDVLTQGVLYYTSNASGNWTLNVRGDGSNTLDSVLTTGDSITIVFLATQGSTAYYSNAFTIDGTSVTPKYITGTAFSAGNASSIDSYVYTIIKTGSATYTVLASQTKFA